MIALVITIIVLLILAGISIATLTGDNGILQKTTDAKVKTEKAQIIENAQIDIFGQQARNNGSDITKRQLAEILNKYFKATTETSIPDEISTVSDVELTTLDEKYTIKISEIYSGKFSKEEKSDIPVSIEQAKGMFVKYNVPYTDAYYYGQDNNHPTYNYTENNGWRILNYDETSGTLDIISTGILAKMFYYNQDPTNSSNVNSRWWGTYNQVKTEYIDQGYGSDNFKASTGYYSDYRAFYAAYGLKHNFSKIVFVQGAQYAGQNGTYNMGFYAGLNNQSGSLDTETKVLTAFTDARYTVTGIREVDAQDIKGVDIGIAPESLDNILPEEDAAGNMNSMGLFMLENIKNMPEMDDYVYADVSVGFWLASPYKYNSNAKECNLSLVFQSGSTSHISDATYGIRPVISLTGVKLTDSDDDGIYEINNK